MFFTYDKTNAISVPAPFQRAMTPMMMADNAGREIPFSVHFTEWEPGCRIDTHAHPDAMEAMYCVSGSGRAMVNGEWMDFVPGVMAVADQNDTHCIENTGTELLRVFCIFSPPITGEGLRARALAAVAAAEQAKKA